MSHEVETMFSSRVVPWHGLGKVLDNPPNSEEAIKEAGLDWTVTPRPIQVCGGKKIPDTFANVRSTDEKVLGIVSKQYVLFQNTEAFSFMDSLVGVEGQLKYETAGSLFGGKQVFLCADLGQFEILGDTIKNYLILTNGHDGKKAIRAIVSPVRVVCNNTLNMAIGRAQRSWNIHHSVKAESRLAEARNALELTKLYAERLDAFAQEQARAKFSQTELDNFVKSLYPVKEDSSATIKKNAQFMIDDLLMRYNEAPDIANFRGTKWGVIQALTDHRDHRPNIKKGVMAENAMRKLVNGDTWLDKAVKTLVAA